MNLRPLALHLAHVDIRIDGRIRKQLDACRDLESVRVEAIGIDREEVGLAVLPIKGVRIDSLKLKMCSPIGRFRSLRYSIILFELILRMVPMAVARRPTVVHCHDALVLPIAAFIKLLTNCALVYDAHELESCKSGQSRVMSIVTLFIERVCWRMVDTLISVSPPILQWYRERLGPKQSVLVLNSPIHSKVKHRSTSQSRYFHQCFGIPLDQKVFIYLGILGRGRGIIQLLAAFGEPLTRSHIVFVGYRDSVGVAEAAKNFPNIHIHPAVPHDQVVDLAREADVGLCLIENVSLSDYLCLPNKLFEYAFAGVPVLASRLPEIARVVNEFGLGICCDNDVESIRNAVRKIEHDGLEKPQGDLSELSWETQAKRLQDAYRVLLGDGARPAPNSKGND